MTIMDFEFESGGKTHRVCCVECLDEDCDRFRYRVTVNGQECEVTASLDGRTCMSGCLDPETRQAACEMLRQEIQEKIRKNHA